LRILIFEHMADRKNSRWRIFTDQLKNKYRLVILNDETFGEKFSFRLSPLGLIVMIGTVTIIMTSLVISLVAFTTLREYIPGYGDVAERKQILELSVKADSLEQTLSARDWYMNNLVNVFSDSLQRKTDKPKKDTSGKFQKVNTKPSENDIQFRKEVESEPSSIQFAGSNIRKSALSNYLFFSPLKGLVTTSFNSVDEHYGVDVVAKKDEMIKSTLDGTVVFTGFTASDGYVIQVQHDNNLVSVYKHNSRILKRSGDKVKSGEAIAVIGNTGENSNGPHLHFELWHNGLPVNPEEFVVF
jgi:murein DD-endopeptidase MepM/ murein hydrolase activator NlpD